jgi:hypothetical protein
MRRPLVLGLFSLALLATALPAAADGWHRGGGGGWHHGDGGGHHGSSVFLGFNFAAPVYPRYAYPYPYPYYYGPPVVYQAPPPVVYQAPPPVAYQAPSSGIALGRDVGQGCREYTAPVNVGGRLVQGYGIACPRPDGTWQIVQ